MIIVNVKYSLTAALMVLFSIAALAAQPSPVATQPAPSKIDLPSFGILVPIPQGFVRSTDDPASVVWFVPVDGSPEKPNRLLWVDIFFANEKPLEAIGQDLARQGRMALGRSDVKWGDQNAIEYVTSDKTGTLRQLLVEKDGFIYRLRSATFSTYKGDSDPYESFIANTHWIAVTHPGDAVAARSPAISLANGMIVNIPDPFRPKPGAKPGSKNVATFEALDLLTKKNAARIMTIAMPKESAPYTLDGLKSDIQKNLADSLGLNEAFRWEATLHEAKGDSRFAQTPHLRTKDGGWVQVLVARLNDKMATAFALEVREPKNDAGMDNVIPLLVQSVRESVTTHDTSTTKSVTTSN